MDADWNSSETHLLLNPRMPEVERKRLASIVDALPLLPAHVWMATSGTSGALKLAALSKAALLASAEAVNRHLAVEAEDSWVCVLPAFHVGGLGIYARAALSGSKVVAFDWDPIRFASERFTLSSLVPAQVRDLVSARLFCPPGVRAVVVGGGSLSAELLDDARTLGWPLLASYGLTEAGSQVATAREPSGALKILPHMEVREVGGLLSLRSPALLTGYGLSDEQGRPCFMDPRRDGWLRTEDRGVVLGDELEIHGREGEFVKIGGESVDLRRLDSILDGVRGLVDAAVVAVHDERLGSVVHLAVTAEPAEIRAAFNERVHPFERARAVRVVADIPRTALGKLRRRELVRLLTEEGEGEGRRTEE